MILAAALFFLWGAETDSVLIKGLEDQIPLFAMIQGNPANSSDSVEWLAIEQSSDTVFQAFLPRRRIEMLVMRKGNQVRLTKVRWCEEGSWIGRCDPWWNRSAEEWAEKRTKWNPKGYRLDSLRLNMRWNRWSQSIPNLKATGKTWTQAMCSQGLCFLVNESDSTLATAVFKSNGRLWWWDGGYIKDVVDEKERLRAWKFIIQRGHRIKGSRGSPAKP